jgi:hypothetical protein
MGLVGITAIIGIQAVYLPAIEVVINGCQEVYLFINLRH